MASPAVLLVGGTGLLGGEIARRLARDGVPFRALVRPASDSTALRALGAEIAGGDMRDTASLEAACAGIGTVISTANSLARLLAGDGSVSIASVDEAGNANLLAAAERAGVERFLFLSMGGGVMDSHSPIVDAKRRMEQRLAVSRIRDVIVRPDMFQEVWMSPAVGFDWQKRSVRIYGKGMTPHRYVAVGDVAEAVVRLAAADDPPREVELEGPVAMSRLEAVAAFERALATPIKVAHVPRAALVVGSKVLRPIKPELASVMGGALFADRTPSPGTEQGFLDLGIRPLGVGAYIDQVTAGGSR
jgi:uncharacterized protein YbjT (DUF2867 family)